MQKLPLFYKLASHVIVRKNVYRDHKRSKNRKRLYSVVVITLGFDPSNPSSNPGTTFTF